MEEIVFKKLLVKILSDRFNEDFDRRMRTHKLIVYMFLIASLLLVRSSLALIIVVTVLSVIVLILASKTVAAQLREEIETTLDNVADLLEEGEEPISETEILWKIANKEI